MNECETDLKTDTENALKKAINKITILEAKNELLKAQIEKMKCCSNCEFDNLEPPEVISNGVCEHCINHSKWKLEN